MVETSQNPAEPSLGTEASSQVKWRGTTHLLVLCPHHQGGEQLTLSLGFDLSGAPLTVSQLFSPVIKGGVWTSYAHLVSCHHQELEEVVRGRKAAGMEIPSTSLRSSE